MFSVMTALLSPRVLETLESRKEVLFSTLQERAGVLCVQPSNGICLLQGEWECMKKAYVVLEEFCLQVQAQNTVQALLRAREEAARRGTTDYQQFLQEYQSQLPPDLYPKLESAASETPDGPRSSTTPNSYQGSDRQPRNTVAESHSSASQDSGHRGTPDDYPPQLTPEGLVRPNPPEDQTQRDVTQEMIDRSQEAYQRPVSPQPIDVVPQTVGYDPQVYTAPQERNRLPSTEPHQTVYGQVSRPEDPNRMDHTFEQPESRDVPLDLKRAYPQGPSVHVSGRPTTSYVRNDNYKDEQNSDNELTIALSEDEDLNRQSQSPSDPHKRSDQMPADHTKYDIPPLDRYSSSHRPSGPMLPTSQSQTDTGQENKSDFSQLQMMSHLFASQSAAYYHMLRTSAAAQYGMPGMEHFRSGVVPMSSQYSSGSGQGANMSRDDPNHALKSPTMSSGYGTLPPGLPTHMNPPSQSSQGDANEDDDDKSESEDDEASSTDKPTGYTYPVVSSQPGETTKLPSLPAWAPMSVRHLTSGVTSSAAAMGAGSNNGGSGVPGGVPMPTATRDPTSGMFQCSACLASFQSRESLHSHMLQAHAVGPGLQPGEGGIPPGVPGPIGTNATGPPPMPSSKPPPAPVPSSSQPPPSPSGYGSDSYCCPVCGKFYKSAQRLREHIMQHDKNYQRPTFPCPACGKTFTYRHNMKVTIKLLSCKYRCYVANLIIFFCKLTNFKFTAALTTCKPFWSLLMYFNDNIGIVHENIYIYALEHARCTGWPIRTGGRQLFWAQIKFRWPRFLKNHH